MWKMHLVLCALVTILFGKNTFLHTSAATAKVAQRRTVIITGANRGIGLAAVKALAETNEWNIVMACRSLERAEIAKKSIKSNENIETCQLDLSDLTSVKKFVTVWGSRPLHVLACNAGEYACIEVVAENCQTIMFVEHESVIMKKCRNAS